MKHSSILNSSLDSRSSCIAVIYYFIKPFFVVGIPNSACPQLNSDPSKAHHACCLPEQRQWHHQLSDTQFRLWLLPTWACPDSSCLPQHGSPDVYWKPSCGHTLTTSFLAKTLLCHGALPPTHTHSVITYNSFSLLHWPLHKDRACPGKQLALSRFWN